MAEAALAGPLGTGRRTGRLWLTLGGLNGALAITVLAASAHGGAATHEADLAELGARFELFHALLLVALGSAVRLWSTRLLDIAAGLALAGCILFSGGLYLDALADVGAFLVPIGGTAFILAWLALAAAGWRARIAE